MNKILVTNEPTKKKKREKNNKIPGMTRIKDQEGFVFWTFICQFDKINMTIGI